MSCTRRFQPTPEIIAKVDEYLQTRNIKGQVTKEMPGGWARITVDTSDPKILTELNEFIWKLETAD
jgi:hypothetical protein